MAVSTVSDLAQSVVFSNVAIAIIAIFGVIVALAIFVKAYCFIMEMTRGTGSGPCPRATLGAFTDPDISSPPRSLNYSHSR